MSLDSDDSHTSSSNNDAVASQYHSEWATSTRRWLDLTRETWREMLAHHFIVRLPIHRYRHKTTANGNFFTYPSEKLKSVSILTGQYEAHIDMFNENSEKQVWDIIHQLKNQAFPEQAECHLPNIPTDAYQDSYNDTCSGFFIEVAQCVHFKLRMSKFKFEEDLGLKKYNTDLFIPLGRILSFFGRDTMLTVDHEILSARYCYGCEIGHPKICESWRQCDECRRTYCDEAFSDVGQSCSHCGYTACCGDMEFWYDENGTEMYCSKCSPYKSFTLDNSDVLSGVEASDISD